MAQRYMDLYRAMRYMDLYRAMLEDENQHIEDAVRTAIVAALHDREAEVERLRKLGDDLVDAIHGLDSYAEASFPCPLERSQRADGAVAAWRAETSGEQK